MRSLANFILIPVLAVPLFAEHPKLPGIPAIFFEEAGIPSAQGPGVRARFETSRICIEVPGEQIRIIPVGSTRVNPVLVDPQPALYSRFEGAESHWQQGLRTYGGVEFRQIYPGVDMRWNSLSRHLKSEFRIAAGASPDQIRLRYEGIASMRVDDGGSLLLHGSAGDFREEPPDAWQLVQGVRTPVNIRYRLLDNNLVAFELGAYDASLPLWIDPLYSYGTYYGGSSTDIATAVATDSSGNMYIAGYTASPNLPLSSPVQVNFGKAVDAFVAKFNPSGNQLLYATYLGGSGDDRALAMAVDATGSAIVVGYTYSAGFPLLSASQPSYGGSRDAFVVKLNATGSALVFSTFLGGTASDSANAVAVDAAGNIYVGGDTRSTDFPVIGAYQASNRGMQDGFVTKFSPTGTRSYSTYLGSAGDDRVLAIAVNATGEVYAGGSTFGADFPVLNAFQPALGGGQDGFLTKLNASGGALVFSTYFGGSAGSVSLPESVNAIALDTAGGVYLAGVTPSLNLPLLKAWQSAIGGGGQDAFVAKLQPTGQALVYSSYMGGLGLDLATSIAVDGIGNAYVAGNTRSVDFPLKSATQAAKGLDYDGFLVQINATPSLAFGTFLGGSGSDSINAIAVASGYVYVAGQTASTDFPKQSAFQATGYTDGSAFLARYVLSGAPSTGTLSPSASTTATQTFTYTFTHSAGFNSLASVYSLVNSSTSPVNGCYWRYAVAKNELSLLNDAASAYLGPINPTSGSTLANSQCTIGGPGTGVTGSGTTLTVVLPIVASPYFVGNRNVYFYASDVSGVNVGWDLRGTWNLAATGTPTFGSISPASGSGVSGTFTFPFKHSNGYAQLTSMYALFNATTSVNSACMWKYVQSTNSLYLLNDAASAYMGPITPSSGSTLQNTQCTIGGPGTSVAGAADTFTIVLPIAFSGTFLGAKNIYMYASDVSNHSAGFTIKGTWTVPLATAPATVSVTPSSGVGASATFSYLFTHTAGYTKLNNVFGLTQSTPAVANGCLWKLNVASGSLYLLNDVASAYLGPVTAGGAGSLQNNQCTILAAGVSATGSGNNLTVNMPITFAGSFAGSKNLYLDATDIYSQDTGFASRGTWTVPSGVPPTLLGVTPSGNTSSIALFTFRYSDVGGSAQIAYVAGLLQSQVSLVNSCSWKYVPSTDSLYLMNDAGTAYLGPAVPGSGNSLSNSQCTLGGSSYVSVYPNGIDVSALITFKAGYSGTKNLYLYAQDVAGFSAGWTSMGTWTVP